MLTPQELYLLSVMAVSETTNAENLEMKLSDLREAGHRMPDYKIGNKKGEPTTVKKYFDNLKRNKLIDDFGTVTPTGIEELGHETKIPVKTVVYLMYKYGN